MKTTSPTRKRTTSPMRKKITSPSSTSDLHRQYQLLMSLSIWCKWMYPSEIRGGVHS
jgi:hypothetical protein